MRVEILEMLEGARAARGLTVVIDVFRAFTLEACLFARGTKVIYAVGAEEQARKLKSENPSAILIGERGGKILPGFDFGNSPYQTEKGNFEGATVIHTTSAGTQGLAAAEHADQIITGSLMNARAIADYIRKENPEQVSLVAMGLAGKSSTPEDTLCARLIKAYLEGTTLDMEQELKDLRESAEGSKFFDPAKQDVFPRQDYDYCVDIDRYDFVIRAEALGNETFRMTPVHF